MSKRNKESDKKQNKKTTKSTKKSTKKQKDDEQEQEGGVDDIIDKEDFSESSESDSDGETRNVDIKEDEEDVLNNKDYGDDQAQEKDEQSDQEEAEDLRSTRDVDADDVDASCLYKFTKKAGSDSDNDDDIEIFDDDNKEVKTELISKPEDRVTKPVLTKYERVRIIGDRAKQLSLGAKPMILNVENMQPKQIAKLELENRSLPFIIEKRLPDGRCDRWHISELKIIN